MNAFILPWIARSRRAAMPGERLPHVRHAPCYPCARLRLRTLPDTPCAPDLSAPKS